MRVSFWLIPAEPFRSELDTLIRNLARRFHAPVFTPHVTIYSGAIDTFTNPQNILDVVLTGAKPIELTSAGISFTNQFTKTLFIQFEQNPQLSLLSENIRRSTPAREPYNLDPHLSLLYATLDVTTQRDLARSITPQSRILFDTLQAISTGGSNLTAVDVEQWSLLATSPFP